MFEHIKAAKLSPVELIYFMLHHPGPNNDLYTAFYDDNGQEVGGIWGGCFSQSPLMFSLIAQEMEFNQICQDTLRQLYRKKITALLKKKNFDCGLEEVSKLHSKLEARAKWVSFIKSLFRK